MLCWDFLFCLEVISLLFLMLWVCCWLMVVCANVKGLNSAVYAGCVSCVVLVKD